MAVGVDPLSLVYNALWAMLEANADLTSLVKVGNRNKYDKIFKLATKDVLSQADLPEVAIVPSGNSFGIQQTSNGTRVSQLYEVRLVTGELRVAQIGGFLPIKWQVMRSFINWQAQLSVLVWSGNTFVKKLTMDSIADSLIDAELTLERGFAGWVSLMQFEVEMWFRTLDAQV